MRNKKQYGYYYCSGNASKFKLLSDTYAMGFSDIREIALNEVGRGSFAVPRRCKRLTKKKERLLRQYGLINLLNGTPIHNKTLYDKIAPFLYFTKLHLSSETSNLTRGSMIEHFHVINRNDSEFKNGIDMRSYTLFLRYGEAMCCAIEKENHILEVSGLVSNHRGHGAKLMQSICNEYKDKNIIVSSHGDAIMQYFKKLGFKVLSKFESEVISHEYYYTMIVPKIKK